MKNKKHHYNTDFFRDWFPVKFKKRNAKNEIRIVQRRFILSEGLTDRFTVVAEKPFADPIFGHRRTVGVLKRVKNQWAIIEPFACAEPFDDLRKAIRRMYKFKVSKKCRAI